MPADGSNQEHNHPSLLKSEKLLTGAEIARALTTPRKRWTAQKARRFLRKSGIGFQLVPRGEWQTTWAKFFERYPALAEKVMHEIESDGACAWCGKPME